MKRPILFGKEGSEGAKKDSKEKDEKKVPKNQGFRISRKRSGGYDIIFQLFTSREQVVAHTKVHPKSTTLRQALLYGTKLQN